MQMYELVCNQEQGIKAIACVPIEISPQHCYVMDGLVRVLVYPQRTQECLQPS